MSNHATADFNKSNDVQVIRNILLGEQFENIQKRCDALDKKVSNLQKENKNLQKALDDAASHQETVTEQIRNEHLNSIKNLRKDLESQIKELSNQLSEYENQQGNLISSLADALLVHQKNLDSGA